MTTFDSQDKKTPHQIESEIDRTRAAISDDIRALGEKLSPEHLKQEAKEVLRDAKEEATDMLRTAKNHAIESVTETVHEISDRARRAGTAASGFASTHAVPLTLLGLGAGWLMLSLRHERALGQRGGPATYNTYGRAHDSHGFIDTARERAGTVAEHALARAESVGATVKETAADLSHRAVELGHRASDAVMEFGHDASLQAHRASAAAVDFTEENPLAIGALAVAAGVGIGLLLPTTSVENSLMGASRDRLVGDARHTAERMRYMAKDAAAELKGALSGA